MTWRALRRVVACAGLLAAAVAVVPAEPAGAHGGTAVIAVEQAAPAGSGVEVRVRVTWSDDGHAATDATVTGLLVPEGGPAPTPVALRPIDAEGRYGAVLAAAPGAFTLRVTVVRPPGVVEQRVEVPASPATVAPSTTGATALPTTAVPTTTGSTTAVPTTVASTAATDLPATTVDRPADGVRRSGVRWRFWLSVGVPVVVTIGAAVVVAVAGRRRRRPG